MPGVADAVKQTQFKQEQVQRRKDMEDLIRMVKENRLHEADERQLDTLKMITDLQQAFETSPAAPALLPQELIEAVRAAVTEAVSNLPIGIGGISSRPQDDPDRPEMKHVSLDLSQGMEDLEISHGDDLGKTKESGDDGEDKLKKLKEIKGKK